MLEANDPNRLPDSPPAAAPPAEFMDRGRAAPLKAATEPPTERRVIPRTPQGDRALQLRVSTQAILMQRSILMGRLLNSMVEQGGAALVIDHCRSAQISSTYAEYSMALASMVDPEKLGRLMSGGVAGAMG